MFPDTELDDAAMQRFGRESILSECVFLARRTGDAVAALRTVTPLRELPFAGHPTIGTAIALVDHLGWLAPIKAAFAQIVTAGNAFVYVALDPPETVDAALLAEPAVRARAGWEEIAGV